MRRVLEYARSLIQTASDPALKMTALLAGEAAKGKPIKGPLGRDPRLLPIYASDERTILGTIKVYVLEECWVKEKDNFGAPVERHLQLYWLGRDLAGFWYFGQPKPETIGKFDAITLHPADREVLIKSSMDAKQRHGGRKIPTAEEKWPEQAEARRKSRGLH